MAQHTNVNLENVAPKLYKKLKQLEKMKIFHNALSDADDFERISVLGLDIRRLPKKYAEYRYPITITNGSNHITDKDWIDLKGIANIEVHFNKDFLIKDCFIVA